jgi:hypothetical protein
MIDLRTQLIINHDAEIDLAPDTLPTTDPCGCNSIICTGLTDFQIYCIDFVFQLLAQMETKDPNGTGEMIHYWPFETPTWEEIKTARFLLLGNEVCV